MSQFVLRSFGALLQRSIEIARPVTSAIPVRWYAACGALYEAVLGKPAPGASFANFRGHQHTPESGGIPLAKGLVGGFGGGSTSAWSRGIEGGDADTWFDWIDDRSPHWYVQVSPGIDYRTTSKNGATCALELRAIVELTGAATSGDIRIYNQTTGAYSSTASFSTGFTRINSIVDIDVQPGENALVAQVRTNATGGTVALHECLFYEIEGNSQPQSAGANTYNSLSRP